MYLAPLGCCGGDYERRNLARRAAAPPPAAAVAAAATPTTYATRGLLAVEVKKLVEGRGFAGELAPVVESTENCTYRVVVVRGGAEGGEGRGGGAGGRSRDSVGVHVRGVYSRAYTCLFSERFEYSAGRTNLFLPTKNVMGTICHTST